MAWTLHQQLVVSNQFDARSQVVVNNAGSVAYIIAANKVFSYDGATLTDITGTAFSSLDSGSGGTPTGICIHGNNLYCLITGAGTTDTGMYRYDGGTTWTLVTQHLDDSDLFPMAYDAYDQYSLSPVASDGTNFCVVSYGSGGAHNRLWSSTDPASPVRVDLSGDYDNPYSTLIGLFNGISTVYGQDDDADKCIEITNIASYLTTGTVTSPLIFAVDNDLQFFSIASGTVWQLGYSTNWGDAITGTGAPLRSSGFPRYWRLYYDGTDIWQCGTGTDNIEAIHKWNDGTKSWDLDKNLSADGLPYGFFILNGRIYCIVSNSATDLQFWDGGEVITVPKAKFYFGFNSLSEQFTLPFSGVSPGGMTLDKSLGTVVIGSNSPTTEPIVYSVHPYITGTSSDDSYPTLASTSSLKWI